MRRLLRSLVGRLVIIGLAQMTVLIAVIVSVIIIIGPPPRRRAAVAASQQGPAPARPCRRRPPPPPLWVVLTTLSAGGVVVGIGGYLTARWILRPLKKLQRTVRVVADGDLSARVDMQRADEIGDVARAFDEMTERVGEMLRSERELLANLSHELRTPLARIGVALDLAHEGDNGAARAALADIKVDLAELESIINDILMAARLSRSAHPSNHGSLLCLSLSDVAPAQLVHEAVNRLHTHHPDRPVVLAVASQLSPLRADARLLRRALDNLLANAHKYSPDPEAVIRVEVDETQGQLVLRIRDQGMGIPPEERQKIFRPFFRVERSRSRDAGGVGLGLALAKQIVEAHAGAIWAQSNRGQGTCMTITLPLRGAPNRQDVFEPTPSLT